MYICATVYAHAYIAPPSQASAPKVRLTYACCHLTSSYIASAQSHVQCCQSRHSTMKGQSSIAREAVQAFSLYMSPMTSRCKGV